MSLVDKALFVANSAFEHKHRKVSGVKHMAHLYEVYNIVTEYGGKEPVQCAAILHNILENASLLLTDIEVVFGPDVARLISRVSEDERKPWHERKEITIQMAEVCCQDIAIIMMADKISDILGFNRQTRCEGFWENLGTSYEDQLWFYQNLIQSLFANKRVSSVSNREYPELRTNDALEELLEQFQTFRRGVLWTPKGIVYGSLTDYLWAYEKIL